MEGGGVGGGGLEEECGGRRLGGVGLRGGDDAVDVEEVVGGGLFSGCVNGVG